jgi:hypothetical protein
VWVCVVRMQTVSKVPSLLPWYGKYTRALTFENFCKLGREARVSPHTAYEWQEGGDQTQEGGDQTKLNAHVNARDGQGGGERERGNFVGALDVARRGRAGGWGKFVDGTGRGKLVNLGAWVNNQRANLRKGRLAPEREAMLLKLGFMFDVSGKTYCQVYCQVYYQVPSKPYTL